jgi:hypothetical protein
MELISYVIIYFTDEFDSIVSICVVSVTLYVHKLFYRNYMQQVLQENEQFLDVILHKPH